MNNLIYSNSIISNFANYGIDINGISRNRIQKNHIIGGPS